MGQKTFLVATIVIALGACAGCAGKEQAKEPTGPGWSATGSMLAARYGHSATLLRDGRVLVAGGAGEDSQLVSAELYDPTAGTWTSTGSMVAPLASAQATLLRDGRVLVVGIAGKRPGVNTAELYDPPSGTWSEAGDTTALRQDYTMTALADGRVLVAGGLDPSTNTSLASAELFDPDSGTWSPTGTMGTPRCGHTATLLRDGTVLVAGELCGAAAAGTGDPGGAAAPAANPANATATGPSGNGGTIEPSPRGPAAPSSASAEVYDPATGTWNPVGDAAAPSRAAAATLLADGRVFVLTPLGAVQIFDPGTETWRPAGTVQGWMSPAAFPLADGRVVVTSFRLLETYDPRTEASLSIETGDATDSGYTATLLADGRVLVAGGYALLSSGGFAPDGEVLGFAHLYRP